MKAVQVKKTQGDPPFRVKYFIMSNTKKRKRIHVQGYAHCPKHGESSKPNKYIPSGKVLELVGFRQLPVYL